MAAKLYNLARMTTATTSTGTITLGSAVSGYLTFALAGVSNGDVVSYAIKDGASSETGTGTYTSAGTTLTRTVTKSTNSNTAINLSGTAEVFITPRAEDLTATVAAVKADQTTGTSTTVAVVPAVQQNHDSSAKAWMYATNSAGTYTVQAAYNCSIVRNSAGNLTVTFTIPFTTANYVVSGAVQSASNGVFTVSPVSASTATLDLRASGSPTDLSFQLVAFGTQ